jgi:hypothetical protein
LDQLETRREGRCNLYRYLSSKDCFSQEVDLGCMQPLGSLIKLVRLRRDTLDKQTNKIVFVGLT